MIGNFLCIYCLSVCVLVGIVSNYMKNNHLYAEFSNFAISDEMRSSSEWKKCSVIFNPDSKKVSTYL